MPKVGMEPIRKSQMIDAVLKIIATEGIKDITLEKAAREAGVSKGVIAYYFTNKETLIIESCETFLQSYAQGIAMLSEFSMPLLEKLRVIAYTAIGRYDAIEGYEALMVAEMPSDSEGYVGLALSLSEQQKIILQLFGESVSNSQFKQLIHKTYMQYFELLEAIIQELLSPHIPETLIPAYTLQYMALIDGILIYDALGFKTEHLLQALDVYLENTFANN